jgi:hypothetical protein
MSQARITVAQSIHNVKEVSTLVLNTFSSGEPSSVHHAKASLLWRRCLGSSGYHEPLCVLFSSPVPGATHLLLLRSQV